MEVDQGSLFVASGICAAALAMTMLSVWVHNRNDRFLIGWMLGLLLLGGGVMLYSLMPPQNQSMMTIAFSMQIVGFGFVYLAARQFTGKVVRRIHALAAFAPLPLVALLILAGLDGLGLALYNLFAGLLLAATAAQYWSARSEAPSSIAAMTVLYALTAVSFMACAAMLVGEARWTLGARPDNWAEQFNAAMCIAGITGIGALSLGLNHARAARRHREEARTDALTGLLNRRALFDAMSVQTLRTGDAVVALDLDLFKEINDRHGHAAGDEVLRRFAQTVHQTRREGDLAARTGGEEFVLVLRDVSLPLASAMAERIRTLFAGAVIHTGSGVLLATASAGVAMAKADGERFEDLLHRADASLYRAKDGGRNRVVTELQAAA